MKLAIAAIAVASGVAASEPNKALGTKLGDVLAAASADPSFAAAYNDAVLSKIPVVTNPAVSEAIRAANAKADAMQSASFLHSKARVGVPSNLNVHIADNANSEAAAAAALGMKARAKLTQLLKDEASSSELLANTVAGQNVRFEAGSSFMKQPAASAADVLGDAQTQAGYFGSLSAQVPNYIAATKAGGYNAARAYASLTNTIAEPNAKTVGQLFSPVLLRALRTQMLKESTPDQMRTAAGSIVTELTGLPISSTVQTKEGAFGHVNIVLPSPTRVYGADESVLSAKAGAGKAYYPSSFLKKAQMEKMALQPFKLPEELMTEANKGSMSVNVIAEQGEDAEGHEMLKAALA
jgi:hypothetical protein